MTYYAACTRKCSCSQIRVPSNACRNCWALRRAARCGRQHTARFSPVRSNDNFALVAAALAVLLMSSCAHTCAGQPVLGACGYGALQVWHMHHLVHRSTQYLISEQACGPVGPL